jgi:hypothetical protein
MALISCKECGKEVAASAPTCPYCGVPYPGKIKGNLSIYRPEYPFVGSIRRLHIFVDEIELTAISLGETFSIELSEGNHTLWGTLAGAKSEIYEIIINAGQTLKMKSWFEAGLFGNKMGFTKS